MEDFYGGSTKIKVFSSACQLYLSLASESYRARKNREVKQVILFRKCPLVLHSQQTKRLRLISSSKRTKKKSNQISTTTERFLQTLCICVHDITCFFCCCFVLVHVTRSVLMKKNSWSLHFLFMSSAKANTKSHTHFHYESAYSNSSTSAKQYKLQYFSGGRAALSNDYSMV